jgi:hypothetical protein
VTSTIPDNRGRRGRASTVVDVLVEHDFHAMRKPIDRSVAITRVIHGSPYLRLLSSSLGIRTVRLNKKIPKFPRQNSLPSLHRWMPRKHALLWVYLMKREAIASIQMDADSLEIPGIATKKCELTLSLMQQIFEKLLVAINAQLTHRIALLLTDRFHATTCFMRDFRNGQTPRERAHNNIFACR